MFIACKYEEIYPIKLKIFYEKISHRRLLPDLILKTESKIMSTLNFELGVSNIWELCGALATDFKIDVFAKYFDKINFLCRMLCYDSDFTCLNNPIEIALAVVGIAVGDKEFSEYVSFKENANLSDFSICEMQKKILKFKSTFENEYQNLKSLEKFSSW